MHRAQPTNTRARVAASTWLAMAASFPLVASVAHADVADDVNARFADALASGNYALAFAMIYFVGLLTALTPCVYPMIAITVSVFGAREAKSKVEAALLSTVFVLGIATPFVPLGIVVGLTGGVFGAWLSSPIVLIGFALFFLAMAASMFGAFDLNLPPSLQEKFSSVEGGIGWKGAFALGFVCAFIAAPCTGPAILGLLAWIGQTRDVVLGGTGMFFYALGLGTLFWVVGTFAVGLPKSGRWMEAVKSVFGVVMIVMALFYLKNLVHIGDYLARTPILLGTGVGLLVLGAAAGAFHLDFKEGTPTERLRKGVGVALASLGAFLAIMWLNLPPVGARIPWRDDFTAAIAEARAHGQPYVIDFGADWCGACGELDRITFTDPRVVAEAERFVTIHVDMTQRTPEKDALLASYRQRGLPLVVFHDASGGESERIIQFVEPDTMLRTMRGVR